MKPIHIFGRIDGVDDLGRIDMGGQRQLHQDAMHQRVGIEARHKRQDLGLGRGGIKLVLETRHTRRDGLHTLVLDIDLAGGILADQDHGKPRHDPMPSLQPRDMGGHLFPHLRGKGLPVDDLRNHA